MSTAVISTSAALGRPFVPNDEEVVVLEVSPSSATNREHQESSITRVFQSTIKNQQSKIPPTTVTPASRLEIRPAPEMVSSGIRALDALTGGLPRGCLTEICGPASSGRTSLLLSALAAATHRGEFCAVVDASDALDPRTALAAGIELDRLLWVRCGEISIGREILPRRRLSTSLRDCTEPVEGAGSGTDKQANQEDRTKSRSTNPTDRLEQVLRAADLLLESGGFGLIALDLGDLPPQAARRIPLTTWFRFRRAIEHTPTMLLAIEQQPVAGSCSSLLLQLGALSTQYSVFSSHGNVVGHVAGAERDTAQDVQPTHAQLLTGLEISAELIRSRLERKPVCSTAVFASKTAWAG